MYGTKEDTNTMFITNMMIIRRILDEELVYDITKATFENIDTVKNSPRRGQGAEPERGRCALDSRCTPEQNGILKRLELE